MFLKYFRITNIYQNRIWYGKFNKYAFEAKINLKEASTEFIKPNLSLKYIFLNIHDMI